MAMEGVKWRPFIRMGGYVTVLDSSRLIDWSYLEEIAGGDQEFVEEILSTYVETASELVRSLQAAAQEGTTDHAIYAAHTLKGSSRSIGAERMARLCQELEESAKSGDMRSFSSLAPSASSEFTVLRAEILNRRRAA